MPAADPGRRGGTFERTRSLARVLGCGIALGSLMLLAAAPVRARVVGDFEIPDYVTRTAAGANLVLVGTGVVQRRYLPFYIVALYRDAGSSGNVDLGDGLEPLRLSLTWLAPTLDAAGMKAYWVSAFTGAADGSQAGRLAPSVERLAHAIGPVSRGDVVSFDYHPDSGLHVARGGQLVAQLPGLEFNRLFLSIWLGSKSDPDLRKALLSQPSTPRVQK